MILTKDYYRTLEVTPAATYYDIKKSYRRLAFQYHPDKNFGNDLFEAKFKEIQEAYQILSDEQKRYEYNRRRPELNQLEKRRPVVTPDSLLKETIDFRNKIAVLDPDRMNKLVLFQQIQHLLDRNNILMLKQNNDSMVNKRIIEDIMFCSRFLPFPHVERICFQLSAIAGSDNVIYQSIYQFLNQVRLKDYWNKYKLFLALVVAIILCFAIFMIGATV